MYLREFKNRTNVKGSGYGGGILNKSFFKTWHCQSQSVKNRHADIF